MREDFAEINPAEFWHVEGAPDRLHSGAIDLHVLHERAQQDTLWIDRGIVGVGTKGSAAILRILVDVKVFFQCVEGIEAKEQSSSRSSVKGSRILEFRFVPRGVIQAHLGADSGPGCDARRAALPRDQR